MANTRTPLGPANHHNSNRTAEEPSDPVETKANVLTGDFSPAKLRKRYLAPRRGGDTYETVTTRPKEDGLHPWIHKNSQDTRCVALAKKIGKLEEQGNETQINNLLFRLALHDMYPQLHPFPLYTKRHDDVHEIHDLTVDKDPEIIDVDVDVDVDTVQFQPVETAATATRVKDEPASDTSPTCTNTGDNTVARNEVLDADIEQPQPVEAATATVKNEPGSDTSPINTNAGNDAVARKDDSVIDPVSSNVRAMAKSNSSGNSIDTPVSEKEQEHRQKVDRHSKQIDSTKERYKLEESDFNTRLNDVEDRFRPQDGAPFLQNLDEYQERETSLSENKSIVKEWKTEILDKGTVLQQSKEKHQLQGKRINESIQSVRSKLESETRPCVQAGLQKKLDLLTSRLASHTAEGDRINQAEQKHKEDTASLQQHDKTVREETIFLKQEGERLRQKQSAIDEIVQERQGWQEKCDKELAHLENLRAQEASLLEAKQQKIRELEAQIALLLEGKDPMFDGAFEDDTSVDSNVSQGSSTRPTKRQPTKNLPKMNAINETGAATFKKSSSTKQKCE